MEIGIGIRLALEARNKSPAWLSDKMGCTRQHVCFLLNSSSCTIKTLEEAAEAIGVKPSRIIKLAERESTK